MQNNQGGTTKYIIDTNKHGIRRDRPAVGYKAVIALNKKLKKKTKKKWQIHISYPQVYPQILIYLLKIPETYA